MNITLTWPDDFREPRAQNSWSSSTEDFVFFSVVAGILLATFFAIIAPLQRTNTEAPAINLRIKVPAPVDQLTGEIPVEEIVDPEPVPLPVLQDSQNLSGNQITITREEPERKLDLSLPRVPAPVQYRPFGVINIPPRSGFGMHDPVNDSGNEASSDTYEPYVNVYGDLLVGISDRCTMNLGSSFGLFDSDIQKVARISCKNSTGKKELDLLFSRFRDQQP